VALLLSITYLFFVIWYSFFEVYLSLWFDPGAIESPRFCRHHMALSGMLSNSKATFSIKFIGDHIT